MQKVLIYLIKLYQKLPISSHNKCRFYPSCSNYAIEAISLYGVFKGCFLSIKRIIRCNPFSKPGYDPVVKIKEK